MKLTTMAKTLGIGAALMYFYDPTRGNRRRALVRDKVNSMVKNADDNIDVAMRDLRNRTRGFFADMMAVVDQENAPDWLLEERVRARMGRNVRHASAVEVQAKEGRVILSGPVLEEEVDRLVKRVASVRGVRGVENKTKVYQNAGDIPGLQGQSTKRMEKPEWAQQNWSPSLRLLSGIGGSILAVYGMSRKGPVGLVTSLTGLSLAARGVANVDMKRLVGMGEFRDAVSIQKAININTSTEELYKFWRNFENFPRFMDHIKEVKDLGGGRSHWKAVGPGGMEVEWDARTTRDIPNEQISWESEPGSQMKTVGTVRFNRNADGTSRLTVHWNYTPPAGALGHAIASLMGADPKKAMDEDLVRMKSLIETGKTTVQGQKVTREQIPATGSTEKEDQPHPAQDHQSGQIQMGDTETGSEFPGEG
jgi:uncharacterized membrane protein